MSEPHPVDRRQFLEAVGWSALAAWSANSSLMAEAAPLAGALAEGAENPLARPNMVGPYGPWLAGQVLGDRPGWLSLRTGQWNDLAVWRSTARQRTRECLAPVDLGGSPEVRVDSRHEHRGLIVEHLETIPEQGTSLRIGDYAIEVVAIADNMVRTARVQVLKSASTAA